MKKQKGKFIVLGGALIALCVMVIFIFMIDTRVTAKYSNEYSRMFGEFTAKTSYGLLKNKEDNSCFSPVSLFATMTLLAEATEGDSQEEIIKALGVTDTESLIDNYTMLLEDIVMEKKEDETRADNDKPILMLSEPSVITLCNSLWLENAYVGEETSVVINECKDKLDCDIFLCDKLDCDAVNSWIEEKTDNLITNVLDGTEDKVAFVNALYYKSNWDVDVKSVEKAEFYLEDGNVVNPYFVSFDIESFKCVLEDDYTMVSVPLKDGEMIYVMPSKKNQLDEIVTERKLNEILALATSKGMEEKNIKLSFPKFEIVEIYEDEDMEGTMDLLGVKEIYSLKSQWKISDKLCGMNFKIVQKNKIVVDEKGVVSSSSTVASSFISGEQEDDYLNITFNRPFLYILMKDNVSLFIGTVYNPAE